MRNHYLFLLGLIATATGLSPSSVQAGDSLAVETATDATAYTIRYQNQPVMVYSFDPRKYKPYVQALAPLKGDNVLRDSPYDHLHHHALMYGIRVNALNFWEETSGNGVQRTVRITPPKLGKNADGKPEARIDQVIYWLAPEDAFLPATNAPTLLVEQRTLTLTIDEAEREVALHWRSRFEVGTKTNTVVLSGANYHGLGMRFMKELDPLAVHFTSVGATQLDNSRQDVTPHPWEAISFKAPARPATIAVFGGPSNAHGPACFFAMRTPFAYLSATQNLDKEPLTYHQGDRFTLDYLVTIYPEFKSAESLSARAGRWKPAP